MSIAQNLKLLNKPIAELAMLPQETIMQMAQMGQIPVAYVAPILEIKAEQAQTGAEIAAMAAQEQMPPGTEIERIIAQNAANEAKAAMPAMPPMAQQMPMQMPEDSGIAALPVDEGMVPEYAGGGIVAFKTGDLVDEFDYDAATRGIDTASGRMPSYSGIYSGLSGDAAAIKAARDEFLGANQSIADLLAYNEAAEKRAEARARQQTGARLLQAGLLGLGGDSPYAFQNLGKMAPAVEGYMGDVEKQEAAKEARSKTAIAAKAAARAEDEKSFSQALQELQARNRLIDEQKFRAGESELDRKNRLAVASMPGETERIAAQIRKEAAANGEKISAEDAARRAKAALTAPPDRYNALSNRLNAANKDIASRTFMLQEQLNVAKTDAERKKIKDQMDAIKGQVLQDYSITPADLAELQAMNRASTGGASTAPATAPKPAAGKFSVRAPDGKTYSFPTQQAADEFERKIKGQ